MLIKKHSAAWDSFITQYSGLITEKERKREKKNKQKPLVAELMIFFVAIAQKINYQIVILVTREESVVL